MDVFSYYCFFLFLVSSASCLATFSAMSFSLSCPYSTLSIILLYNKEVASRTLCGLSASASRVAAAGADTALCKFAI